MKYYQIREQRLKEIYKYDQIKKEVKDGQKEKTASEK